MLDKIFSKLERFLPEKYRLSYTFIKVLSVLKTYQRILITFKYT